MNEYKAMKDRQQKRVNEFPAMFAFNENQFSEGLRKLNTTKKDLVSIGAGGFIRRKDAAAFLQMLADFRSEKAAAIAADTTGDGFIFDMFDYELSNHEYSYTGDLTDTLEAVELTPEEINESPALLHGLEKAIAAQREGL